MAYQPKGRTDEASFDYTDDPAGLLMRFDREVLDDELAFAEREGNQWCVLKFDYEEHVPIEAVRAALAIRRTQ
jgi:hypothetical protein